MTAPRIKVTSPSFSRNPVLREELLATFPMTAFNESGGHLAGPALAEFLAGADGAVIGLEAIDAALLDACRRLRIVAKYGVGLDNIDADACRSRGVALGWTGGVNRRSVAELTLAFMIGLCRNVFATSRQLHDGVWNKDGGVQLSGLTVGIIGFGHVGRDVARLLAPFGCPILVNDINPDAWHGWGGPPVTPVTKEELYAAADVVTLHVPLTPQTLGLIDATALARLKPGARLINTARGGLVDEAALKEALRNGQLSGAALDVFAIEPPADPELLALPTLAGTPHIGGSAREAVMAMGRSAIDHLRRHFGS